ncbi:MAG: SpoIIE family protein phosphatase [Bacteroidetes bacterium]|nr:SpoIIE family protein phosphatase [Bacteroidota bacterium]
MKIGFKFRLTIARKILFGFLVIIVLIILTSVYNSIILNQGRSLDAKITREIEPSLKQLDRFYQFVIESKMLITNWIYLESNTKDKERLEELHNIEYPILKVKTVNLIKHWDNKQDIEKMKLAIEKLDNILSIEKEIMSALTTFEDYEDPMKMIISEDQLESEIIPGFEEVLSEVSKIINSKQRIVRKEKDVMFNSFSNLQYIIIILAFISVLLGIFISLYTAKIITKPLLNLKNNILYLSKGLHPSKMAYNKQDEIGEMTNAVNILVDGLKDTAMFADKIGKGDFDVDFKKLSNDDVLGNALLKMRDSLRESSEKDADNKWEISGHARFGDIFQHNDPLQKTGYEILSGLIDYLSANQGVLYVTKNDVSEKEKKLEIIAHYACKLNGKEKESIKFGEDLVGEAAQNQKTVNLKDLPAKYMRVSSGLVDAKPNNVLIIPLILNKVTYGVLELSSLNKFTPVQIEFLENLAEKIAVTINNIQGNENTQRLLQESQEKSEELQMREEELKQQNEELNTAQEQLQKVNQEVTEANTKVRESIDYAHRIQESILPEAKNIQQIFPQSFIYYKPKDVVSGDFPWFYKKGDDIYIATVDCTGHGVPGALLSFIGYFLLNEIVGHRKILTPAEVLDLLSVGVKRTLRQDEGGDKASDGMDIALCKINLNQREVQFAGAYRPLYHLPANGKVIAGQAGLNGGLKQYKGDRHPIGGIHHKGSSRFTNHSIKIKKGDSIFFFTDGLADQFGGADPEEDQYSPKRIQDIILNNQRLSMPELAAKFEKDFEEWKGDEMQYDDVLMIGIRF